MTTAPPSADDRCNPNGAIIVGGGLAGLCAGIRAAELGTAVTVLEAGTSEYYACNSRLAMGFINVAFEDIGNPPERLRAAIDRATAGQAEPALADVLAREAAPALAWLRAMGVRTIVGNWRPGSAAMLAPPAAVGPGLHWRGRGADRMLRLLERRLVALGGTLRRGVRVRGLSLRGATCIGVEAEWGGETRTIAAAAVVIADGGFAGDAALLREHVAPAGGLLQRNAGSARGYGLRMAKKAGARVTPLAGFYGHVQCADAVSDARLWPYPTCDHLCGAGIAVDRHAQRFADEGRGGIFVANAIAALADPAGAVAIFDNDAWMRRGTAFPLPANPLLVTAGGTIHTAATLTELAHRAGLPADALEATVNSYNQALAAGTSATLVPPRTATAMPPLPIAVPPFHAVPLVAGITYTTGGIAIDDSCRVIHSSGGPIAGLYAAGSATGGHESGTTGGYTGGLAKALVFGRRAGETVAADLRDRNVGAVSARGDRPLEVIAR